MDKTFKYFLPILFKNCQLGSGYKFVNPVLGTKTSVNFVANFLKNKRVIYFGEIHGVPQIVKFQECILDFLINQVKDERQEKEKGSKVVVIMEHFAGPEHQRLLDAYMCQEVNQMSFESFCKLYDELGEEGHDLKPYSNLLRIAKENAGTVEVKAGFIPRSYAKRLVSEGVDVGLKAAYGDGYLNPNFDYMPGSDNHYNFFESLISGRDMAHPPSDRFRKIFPAQIIKDAAMANVVVTELQQSDTNRFLVICGSGHCEYRFGVPERVDKTNVISMDETCIISTRHMDHYEISWASSTCDPQEVDVPLVDGPFEKVEAFETPFPADLIFFYGGDDAPSEPTKDEPSNEDERIKGEIADAYDAVGDTAHLPGDSQLAAAVMKLLDYNDDEITIAGGDAFNYQGVGNPHKHAPIKMGDSVLDLGSGLGIDSFIAAERVGEVGLVTGLDISKGEVVFATKRAKARGVENRVKFLTADMEKMPLEDNSFDIVISNGAFCLAPNKAKAFSEIYRVLKPGGHFSVACTTLLKELDTDVNWPICMRVFMPLANARPMLSEIGFENVGIDSSNSLMSFPVEDKQSFDIDQNESNTRLDSESSKGRSKIHVGSSEFKHLENFDMNQLCARVVLHGMKPMS